MHQTQRLRRATGFTILEVLIAALITGILAVASFSFYVTMHGQSLTQQEISDMQQAGRVTLSELAKSIRMAGYKLSGHEPYRIAKDSLWLYYSMTQPVDTTVYYLCEFDGLDYAKCGPLPVGKRFYKLMRQVNSEPAQTYADYVQSVQFTEIDSVTIAVAVTTEASKRDDAYDPNGGYHTYTGTERVVLRNLNF